MFVCTLHKQSIKKVAALCAFAVIAVGAVIGIKAFMSSGNNVKAAAADVRAKTQISDAQTLTTYLAGFGIEADAATASVTTVKIPRKWDDSFIAFNTVIQQSGLDLTKYKNKKADRWMINIPLLTTENEKTYAIVLAYENEPIGAYILQKPSGEVLPLTNSKQTLAEADSGIETEATADSVDVSTDIEFGAAAQSTAAEVTNPSAFPTE